MLGLCLVSGKRNLKLCTLDEMKINFYHMKKYFETEDLGMLRGSSEMSEIQVSFNSLFLLM